MKPLSYFVLIVFYFAAPVHAAPVYSGCLTPPTTFRHVWYFDPVHGKTQAAGGNGSQASPWNKLQALIQAEPGYSYPLLSTAPYLQSVGAGKPWATVVGPKAGPIAPGDEILLMSGNYGDLWANIWQAEITNPAFVTIAAAPGQTPVLTSLFVSGSDDWAFSGLKVQSLQPAALSGTALVEVADGGANFPTSNIVFENMTISSQDNVSAWSQAQWVANARTGFFARSTPGVTSSKCVSFTGSHISNVRSGALITTNQVLFSNNQIDHFGDDGIDYGGSNLAITHNDIHDNLDVGDGNHEDAMQGVIGFLAPGATVNLFENVLIDSNLVIRQTDPHLTFPTYLQGIDAFDSDWTNVTVTNNIVIASACWGIYFASVHNSLIANNTVVEDSRVSTPGCIATVAVDDKTHEGASSSNTTVRNNLASQISLYTLDSGVSGDHNVAMCCSGRAISWYVNGAIQYLSKPGAYAGGNIIDAGGTNGEFVNYNSATMTYNLLLKTGAQAVGPGTATGAPVVDILGVKRVAPYAVGAYSYPN